MAVDVVDLLRELDFTIAEGASPDSWLLRAPDGASFEVSLPSPVPRLDAHATRHLVAHQRAGRRILAVGESVTERVLQRAVKGQIDILTASPARLVHAGVTYTAEEDPDLQQARPATKRPAWTRWAVERYLLLAAEPARQSLIASVLGTSQQSVSNAARHLAGLVADHGDGLIVTDRAGLLEHWRDEYAGPGGQEFGWYSLDPVTDQVISAVRAATLLDVRPLVSGDVAADLLAPWKLPTQGRIYVDGPVDLAEEGFVPAPVDDATLVTCVPRDPSIWRLADPPAVTPSTHGEVRLADAAIIYWDVAESTDLDSGPAAEQLALLVAQGKR
ncbi:helix-turn-helix domain-containing protein [Isoptericola sp. NEAU-Y5]|uniref:Helix-turn-helix domain-containing protein n=1 Tax=Isoptericola luteus TaxID=2879484 RepID=A0ABS7ZCV0_9MICO|nr:helix-turn-helix domain-containing protein [Isoptericola sp. NEAU-Y5]MCA5892878.1 helix-turn-helix domain-containing protein [Isoptericola sp. NEAU-Y5]